MAVEAGGGWYGGGSSDGENGGGSNWAFTETNYNTWKNANSTDASQYLLKDHPEYYLKDAQIKAGNQSFTSPTGTNEKVWK